MPEQASHFRFGSFELDSASGELRKSGIRLRLEDQPFRLLVALIERQGKVLTREYLRAALWPQDTDVAFDRSLTRGINKVRTALGDTAVNPRFIETLPRRGYRFVAPVSVAAVPVAQSEPVPDSVPSSPPESHSPWRKSALVFLPIVMIASIWILWARSDPKPVAAIAILPLEATIAIGQEPGYFSDGMTDQLIAALSHIGSLRVVSQTSVMRYKGARKPFSEIARELNVQTLLEGSVTQSHGRVRINARLLRFPGEEPLWTRTYERNSADILSLQNELARNIAAETGAIVTPRERERLTTAAQTVDPALHALYLKGLVFANEPTSREILERGIRNLEEVVEKDPGHAAAYAAMAEAWFNLSSVYLSPASAMPKARSAALKAIELDPESDAAHTVLGGVHLFYDWDWQAAALEYKNALDINPSSSAAHRGISYLNQAIGETGKSLAAIDHALLLDPLSLLAHLQASLALASAGRNHEAIRQAHRTLEREPGSSHMRSILAMIYAENHDFRTAIREGEAAVQSQKVPATLGILAQVYAKAGWKADAERTLRELVALSTEQYVCPFEIASAFSSLGRMDEAFAWMTKAVRERADCMIWLRSRPWLGEMRSDARYGALVRQLGFPTIAQQF